MSYETLEVRFEGSICFVQIDRPEANNTINGQLIADCSEILRRCEESTTILVLSGGPEVFCLGADFSALSRSFVQEESEENGAAALYDLWLKFATGPYVTIAHVRGKANAGGLGFVAASDIALADSTAQFGLSEMLFGLYPACVLPFLVRRIGFQKAHYLALTTQPISASRALDWGLVDAVDAQSDDLLRRHLLRLRRLSKPAIRRYKDYMRQMLMPLADLKSRAVAANREVFADTDNRQAITRYLEQGVFPWEN